MNRSWGHYLFYTKMQTSSILVLATYRKQMTPEYLFRQLREAWFQKVLMSRPHEKEWEDEVMKREFDKQTEELLAGQIRSIAPHRSYDMLHRLET